MIVSAVFTRAVVGAPEITVGFDTTRTMQDPLFVVGFDGPRDHLNICLDPQDTVRLRDTLTAALTMEGLA